MFAQIEIIARQCVSCGERRKSARRLADRCSHLDRRVAKLSHAPSGFPLRLSSDVSVKPETLLALGDDLKGIAELAIRD